MKSKITNFVIYIIIGLMLGIIYYSNNVPDKITTKSIVELISNSSLIPGVILLCMYVLTLVSKEGIFDGIGYGLKSFTSRLIPSKSTYDIKTYGDYKAEKEEKRKESQSELLIIALVFIVISIVSYLIYKVI